MDQRSGPAKRNGSGSCKEKVTESAGTHDAGRAANPDSPGQFTAQLGELGEYLACYLNAQVGKLKLALRRTAIYLLLAVVAAFASFAVILTTIWLLLAGIAEGIGSQLGGRTWLGNIVVALGAIVSLVGAGWLVVARSKRRSYLRAVGAYERRLREQRRRFGHSASDRSKIREHG